MKRNVINGFLLVAGLFCYNTMFELLRSVIRTDWLAMSRSGLVATVLIGFFFTAFMLVWGVSFHAALGNGSSIHASRGMKKGQVVEITKVVEMGLGTAGTTYLALRRYPFKHSPQLVEFEEKQLHSKIEEGWKYIWDGKKLVSVKD